jgi:hypothetical protein
MQDFSWATSVPEKGYFLCFAFRMDTRKIPPVVLRLHLDQALKEEKKRTDANFVSRERKKELKEQVSLRLSARIPQLVFHQSIRLICCVPSVSLPCVLQGYPSFLTRGFCILLQV